MPPARLGDFAGSSVDRVMRYCTKRPAGASVCALSPSACSIDQSLQVSSGSATLPERTATLTRVPSGASDFQRSEPHLLTIFASCTSEVIVPLAQYLSSRT